MGGKQQEGEVCKWGVLVAARGVHEVGKLQQEMWDEVWEAGRGVGGMQRVGGRGCASGAHPIVSNKCSG